MKLNDILRKIVIAGIFITPFVPLLVMPSLFFPFIVGKNLLFRVIVEIIFFAWLALAFSDASYRPKKTSVFWGFLAFVVIMIFADAFGANPYKSFWSNFERMEGFITLIHLFLFFIVASSVLAREKIWDWLIKTTLGVSIYISLYGVLQLLGFLTINQGGVRVDGTFGNATYLAIYNVFIIFFCAIFAVREWNKKISPIAMKASFGGILLVLFLFLLSLTQATVPHVALAATVGIVIILLAVLAVFLAQKYSVAWIYGAVALINLVILYYTATRGAILGFIGAIALMAFIGLFAGKQMKSLRTVSIWILGATLIIILGFLGIKNTSFVRNSPVLERFASISFNSAETDARLYVWNMAIKGFEERPILGWGQENFNLVFNKFYDPRMYSQEQWFDRTHDVVLDWLINGGILGLAAYLFLLGSAVWLLWKRAQISFAEKLLFTGLFAAYFINNIFVFDNITSYILYVSVLAYIQAESTKSAAVSENAKVLSQETAARIVVPIVVIVGVFTIYVLNWPGYSTGRSLINALITFSSGTVGNDQVNAGLSYFEQAIKDDSIFGIQEEGLYEIREQLVSATQNVVQSSADASVKQAFAQFAFSQVQAQLQATPYDARYQLFAANFYQVVGMNDQAEAAYKEAITLSPNKQSILSQLGALYISEKRYDDAFAIFKESYMADTSDVDAEKQYAGAAIYDGQTDVANSLMSGNPDVALSDEVAKAYVDTNQWLKLVALFETRIATLPEDVNNRTSLVAAYAKAGENAKAIDAINTLVKLYPSYADVGKQAIADIESGKGL